MTSFSIICMSDLCCFKRCMAGVFGRMAQQASGREMFFGSFCFMDTFVHITFSIVHSTLGYLT